ncbi:hypothetical protein F2P56_029510 [Juglans regia]|uniref:Uncharacterized protein n=1 Tax=Juglans regia TaxID=51240 RepID=A0A833WY95_JUGRE|nr:hypothetical protein F2P56_029510 [Juglans regia]
MAPICAPPVAPSAQKLPTASGEHSGEPVFLREELEEGEMEPETLRVISPSSLGGLLMGSAQTQSCVALEGPDAACVVSPAEEGILGDNLSPIRGLCLEKAQFTPCEVDGGLVVNPVQSMLSEHDPSLLKSLSDSQSMEMVSFEENKSGGLEFSVSASGERESMCGSELDIFTPASTGEEGAILTPLCTLPPYYGSGSSKWVFKKV